MLLNHTKTPNCAFTILLLQLSDKASFGLHSLMVADDTFTDESPIQIAKAVKNATEIGGMRNAHVSYDMT